MRKERSKRKTQFSPDDKRFIITEVFEHYRQLVPLTLCTVLHGHCLVGLWWRLCLWPGCRLRHHVGEIDCVVRCEAVAFHSSICCFCLLLPSASCPGGSATTVPRKPPRHSHWTSTRTRTSLVALPQCTSSHRPVAVCLCRTQCIRGH